MEGSNPIHLTLINAKDVKNNYYKIFFMLIRDLIVWIRGPQRVFFWPLSKMIALFVMFFYLPSSFNQSRISLVSFSPWEIRFSIVLVERSNALFDLSFRSSLSSICTTSPHNLNLPFNNDV